MTPNLSVVQAATVGVGVGGLLAASSVANLGTATMRRDDWVRVAKTALVGGAVAGGVYSLMWNGLKMADMAGSQNYVKIGAGGGAIFGIAMAILQQRLDDLPYLAMTTGGGAIVGAGVGWLMNYKDLQ